MSDEKKIIVDEDWKSQVAAEKEALAREHSAAAPSPAGEAASAAGHTPQDVASSTARPPLPPASFEMLVTMFATEAMIGLGQLPHPITQKVQVDADQARYAIDMLEMLSAKTQGNLTPAEEHGLGDLLHQLRLAFVASKRSDQPSGGMT